jgi:hypothetical protein
MYYNYIKIFPRGQKIVAAASAVIAPTLYSEARDCYNKTTLWISKNIIARSVANFFAKVI